MKSEACAHNQEHVDAVLLYALSALSPSETLAVERQISTCADCHNEIENLRPIVHSFVAWPTDMPRPPDALWDRLASCIAEESGEPPLARPRKSSNQPQWKTVSPGIHVQILARDDERDIVSMLVRLDPGTDYPGHEHAGIEELHLLYGELKVDHRTLRPGDFIHAEAGTVDRRVWSETGCTCFLTTSVNDALF